MSTITETKIENIKLENIFPSSTNPRKSFDEKGLQDLANSIDSVGLLQPIMVRPIIDSFDKDGLSQYEIIYGERRYRASKLAGHSTIKAQIEYMDDDKAFEIQVLENLQREDINPLDEARAFQSLMKKETLDWLASKINKSKKYVLDRVKLLDLCETALTELESGVLPLGHAVLLSKIDIEKQEKVIKASNLFLEKRISDGVTQVYCAKTLSQLKEYIASTMLSFDRVNFDLNDADLIPKAGSCQACPKRTINQNLLFGDITENDLCTDSLCFNSKLQKKVEQNVEKVREEFGEVQVGEKDQWSSHCVIVNKERLTFNNEKTEKYTIPVVINKTGNYDINNLGKTVWVQSPEDLKAEVQEEKSSYSNNWETNQNKKIDELVVPRYKEVFEALLTDFPFSIIESSICLNIVDAFMIEKLVSGSFNKTLIVCNLLGIKTDVELTGAALREYKDSLSRDEQYELQFELSKQLVENHSLEMICNILVLDDVIEMDIEMDEEIEAWEISIKRYFKIIGILENSVEEIETESEEVNTPVDSIEELENTLQEEIGEGSSAITSTLDIPTFEKIVTKKRYALNNSYFKNRLPQMPATPLEVMYYFNQHGELPFDMGSDTENWLYECYVEYQKRAGVYGSQYFTPPATAQRMAELADEYFNYEDGVPYVLDACCGFGMLTEAVKEKGFIVNGFDNNIEIIELYKQFTGCISENIDFTDSAVLGKYRNVITNPPYEIPTLTKFLEVLYDTILEDGGVAILLLPKNFIDKDKPKPLVWILSNYTVVHREDMNEEFARTKINAEIVVLKKS